MTGSSWDAKDIRRAIEEGELMALAHAGYMNYNDAEYISSFVQHYEPIEPDDPKRAQDTERYRKLVTRLSTREINRAVAAGNTGRLAFGAGHQSDRVDATGYSRLMDSLERPAEQFLLRGPKGSGKSTKAVDLAKRLHRHFDGNLKIWTNIEGIEHPDVTFGETLSSLLEFNNQRGEKLAILDEASTAVNAYAGQGYEVEQTFGKVINALRKGAGGSTRLIAIGHMNDSDIHPILRKQSDVVMKAEGKERDIDKATVYQGWQAYKQGDEWFKLQGLEDVTEAEWRFSSDYFATLEFDLDDPDRQIRRGRLVEDWRKYQESDTPGQTQSNEPDPSKTRCFGVKDDGSRCGVSSTSRIGAHGYCKHHRDQWEEDAQPAYKRDEDDNEGGSQDSVEADPTPNGDKDQSSDDDLIHK